MLEPRAQQERYEALLGMVWNLRCLWADGRLGSSGMLSQKQLKWW